LIEINRGNTQDERKHHGGERFHGSSSNGGFTWAAGNFRCAYTYRVLQSFATKSGV
jgi:hypothetical protein